MKISFSTLLLIGAAFSFSGCESYILGTVTDNKGKALEKAYITLSYNTLDEAPTWDYTDKNGSYTMFSEKDTEVTVSAVLAGYVTQSKVVQSSAYDLEEEIVDFKLVPRVYAFSQINAHITKGFSGDYDENTIGYTTVDSINHAYITEPTVQLDLDVQNSIIMQENGFITLEFNLTNADWDYTYKYHTKKTFNVDKFISADDESVLNLGELEFKPNRIQACLVDANDNPLIENFSHVTVNGEPAQNFTIEDNNIVFYMISDKERYTLEVFDKDNNSAKGEFLNYGDNTGVYTNKAERGCFKVQ